MKHYVFTNPSGKVTVKADIIGSNAGGNATIMEVKTEPVSGTVDAFHDSFPKMDLQRMVNSKVDMVALATDQNFTLAVYDNGVAEPSTLFTRITTTTTTTTTTP